jgi:uncharacterized membrane protein
MATQLSEHLSQALLHRAYDSLAPDQRKVIDAVAHESPTGRSPELAPATFGERLADRVAAIGGSWAFIGAFAVVLLGWMLINSPVMKAFGIVFDPYPYIFLNLMLSTLAAIQAPIIMMSQNRSAAKDRLSAEHDYQVNLRAELEILRLHDRLDAIETERLPRLAAQQAEIIGLLRAR